MNILLFGPPGAGKGTQSSLLVSKRDFVQISTGDILRGAISRKTELGSLAQAFMSRGQLVPDDLVISLVKQALEQIKGDFILDGFPRTVAQAEALEVLLKGIEKEIERAIFISVPVGALVKRLSGRRVCKLCGSVFHIENKQPKLNGVCDSCGGELVQRDDDKESVIDERMRAYSKHTAPLIEYYKKLGKYFEVNGDKDEAAVFANIEEILNFT